MKITAAPQVFDCLLKVAKSNLYLIDMSKNLCANCTAAPQPCPANCLRELRCFTMLIMWVMPGALSFEIIHLVILSYRSQSVLQRGCAASPRVRDILIPIASDVYLESMPENLLQGSSAASYLRLLCLKMAEALSCSAILVQFCARLEI